MVALEYSDSKIRQKAVRLRGRLPYRGLLLALPLYVAIAVLAGWHWSGHQLNTYLAEKRAEADSAAAAAAAPLERRIATLMQVAATLAAQPDITATLGAVNLFRRHDGAQSIDHVNCDAGQGQALSTALRTIARDNDVNAIAVLDGFGDCQAASQAVAPRHLFGPRSDPVLVSRQSQAASLHVVNDGKSRPLGFAVTAASHDARGHALGSVSLYLSRGRINGMLPDTGDAAAGRKTWISFDAGNTRSLPSWTQAAKRDDAKLLKFAMRGASGFDLAAVHDGWVLCGIRRIGGVAAVHSSLPVDPLGYRLASFCLVVLGALALPVLYLLAALVDRRRSLAV